MMTDSREEPYEPSWIDRFENWVERLPVRAWIFYVVLGAALIVVQIPFLLLDGGRHAGELLPIIIFNALVIPFLLALLHFLDHQAVTALKAMRPALDMAEQEFDDYAFRLSNMPFFAPLVAGAVLTIATILTPLVTAEPLRFAAIEQLPVTFQAVFHIIDKSSAFLIGVILYHTIRQLRLVNSITSSHVRVNLFHLKPLQAFSKLTAATALGLLAIIYVWMIINPELLRDPVLFGYVLLFTVLAVVVFIWPLWGIHKLMQVEKQRALQEVDSRFEAAFSKFNRLVNDEDQAAIEQLNGVILSLDIQHKRIDAIPTWPWSSETGRVALTAIALPVILMIIQYFVLQALNR